MKSEYNLQQNKSNMTTVSHHCSLRTRV